MKMFRIALLIIAAVLFLRAPLYADSQQIRRDFFAQLEREKNFGGYSLDIEVIAGVVTARGNVSNAISKARVSEIALSLKGVRRVINEVEVIPTTQAGAQPHSIAQLITERTRRELTSEGYSLNVLLEGKDIVLQGTVDTVKGARQIVAIAESSAPGSVVRNQLVVKEEVLTDSELRSRVLKALALDEQIRTDDLTIRAENGVIYIAGSRPEHRSIDRILSTVIMVDGVKDVKSSVVISKQ
jgi:osmotically-inducible protein OsmY